MKRNGFADQCHMLSEKLEMRGLFHLLYGHYTMRGGALLGEPQKRYLPSVSPLSMS